MNQFTVKELAKAGKTRLFGQSDLIVNNIVIDSRNTEDNTMFVCIVGENNDGHKFANQAYENGCRVFLMSDPQIASNMLETHSDISILLTDDTELAFKQMALWHLDSIHAGRIGITGSVGKTTTKSLTAAVLSAKYNVVCSQKNYNTSLGLCMTAFLADTNTDFIVFEMGMDRLGEIDDYCSWVRPETAIITLIGNSHLERLGSKENIARAKFEITNYMNDDDVLIFNSDSPFLDMYTLSKMTKANYVPIPVGTRSDASARIANIVDKGIGGISFDLMIKNETIHIDLPLLGKHNASNAALAASCGLLYNVEAQDIAKALSAVSGTDRRLSFEDINGLLLLDDSYNANPSSMCAAIDVLMGINAKRHVAVLADMYELGEDEKPGHIMVGEKVGTSGVDLLISVGNYSKLMADAAKSCSDRTKTICFDKLENSMETIINLIGPGDAVLVKGSNATKISAVAETIRSFAKQV